MPRSEALAIVSLVWSGEKRSDARLPMALQVLGIERSVFARCVQQAKSVERSFSRLFVLTPSGHGQRV